MKLRDFMTVMEAALLHVYIEPIDLQRYHSSGPTPVREQPLLFCILNI